MNFNKLCKYYLDCIKTENLNVVFSQADNISKAFDYLSIDSFPVSSFMADEKLQKFLVRHNNQIMSIGYPCYYDEKGFLKPVFVYEAAIKDGETSIDLSSPMLNVEAIQGLFQEDLPKDFWDYIDENIDRLNRFDEIKEVLSPVFVDVKWLKSKDPLVSKTTKSAIIDQAIIFPSATLSAGYTAGLAKELEELSTKPLSALKHTALYKLLMVEDIKGHKPSNNENMLEVCYLNHEQKQAVVNALNNEATIITGPPGTGKSQVITNLLINAALRKKKILFASKNNKAVDVVEQRVNQLADRPILLRQGNNKYLPKLEEYVSKLLSQKSTDKERTQYDESRQKYLAAIASDSSINKTIEEIIQTRNTLDKQEQLVENFRKSNKRLFRKSKELDIEDCYRQFHSLRKYVFLMDIDSHSIFYKMKLYFFKIKMTERFNAHLQDVQAFCKKMSVDFKLEYGFFQKEHVDYYKEKIDLLKSCLDNVKTTQEYFSLLQKIKQYPPLTKLYKQQEEAHEEIVDASRRMWRLYLKLQSNDISVQKRKEIADLLSDIKYIVASGKHAVSYDKLRPISEYLPCWSVTSLSAKGKIPFQPGFFDYVVFDEASQCDIASALPLLYRAKNVIVVGDEKQLPHIANLKLDEDRKLMKKYGVDENSRFSYTTSSLYNLTRPIEENHKVDLKNHYRCHPDIIGFSNRHFYEGKLRNATDIKRLDVVDGSSGGITWMNIVGTAVRPLGGGALNKKEAEKVINVLEDILYNKAYNGSIGVVTPFRAQANYIRELAFKNNKVQRKMKSCDMLIDTAHKFQGDERDLMIFSPTLSKDSPEGAKFFLEKQGNVFNVAITRARANLIVVGDYKYCSSCNIAFLSEFAKYINVIEQPSKKIYESLPQSELSSEIEKEFYTELLTNGIDDVIPQYNEAGYCLDFAILRGNKKLNIEVDGEYYHKDWNNEICISDRVRNNVLTGRGWDVMRFWVYEIRDDLPACISRIKDWIKSN
jgi:very-short-patch-repair endonuclease